MKVWVRVILYTFMLSYILLYNLRHFYAISAFIWFWTLLYDPKLNTYILTTFLTNILTTFWFYKSHTIGYFWVSIINELEWLHKYKSGAVHKYSIEVYRYSPTSCYKAPSLLLPTCRKIFVCNYRNIFEESSTTFEFIEELLSSNLNLNANFPWKRPIISMNYFERVSQELWPQIKKHVLYITHVLQQSFLNKITIGCLLNFAFLEVYMHLIAIFICNDKIFERIFISVFWILVLSMLNLHFSVNYKAFKLRLHF